MEEIKRIIFASDSGTSRAAMAAGILRSLPEAADFSVEARGLLVQFPEPLNQKAEAVMISNGIVWENFSSRQLEESDFEDGTMVFTMSADQRQKILETYDGATEENTRVLSAYVGDELEIVDPYGGSLQVYGLCFEVLKNAIERLPKKLREEERHEWQASGLYQLGRIFYGGGVPFRHAFQGSPHTGGRLYCQRGQQDFVHGL